jgi:predicted nucleic acid-binding protein
MSKLVVDARVAAKWLVTEPLSEKALDVLGSSDELYAPDLLLAEVGNILWKKARAGDLAPPAAQERLRALLSMGVTLVPASGLGERAVALALGLGRTVYDSLYLALAEAEGCDFVTADERLVNAVAHAPIAARAKWLGAR